MDMTITVIVVGYTRPCAVFIALRQLADWGVNKKKLLSGAC